MTVEPSYRLGNVMPWGTDIDDLIARGALVPDTRLQYIADAHTEYLSAVSALEDAKPELATVFGLLDALIDGNNTT